MKPYLVLLRGINVGGKNRVPMADLRSLLERLGFENVSTHIAGGNVFLDSDLSAERTKSRLGRIAGTPVYASLTIRSWQTTIALLDLMRKRPSPRPAASRRRHRRSSSLFWSTNTSANSGRFPGRSGRG